jgi:hypothetical protein
MVKLTIMEVSDMLISKEQLARYGIYKGLEGGTVILHEGEFHLFVTEELKTWDLTRNGHWKSGDGLVWQRVGTLNDSVDRPRDPRHAVWAPMPFYNEEEGRWNLFYVGYEDGNGANCEYNGRVFRAVSSILGRGGLNGPYIDTPGTVLSFTDAGKDPWEGGQGADSFYLYPVKDQWRAFYGSYGTSYQWCVGLAWADHIAGPWRRDGELEPVFEYAENPIVLPLPEGGYLCVYDDLAHGINDCSSIGYGYSADGIVWEKGFAFLERPQWAACIRTPQSLIPIGDGEYWVYFSACAKAGPDSIGQMRVKVSY